MEEEKKEGIKALAGMLLISAVFFGGLAISSEKYRSDAPIYAKESNPAIFLKIVEIDEKNSIVKFKWGIENFPPAENGDYWFYVEKSVDGGKTWNRDSLYTPIPANILDAFEDAGSRVINDKAMREKSMENALYRIKAVIGPEYKKEDMSRKWEKEEEKEFVVSNTIETKAVN